MTTGEVLSQSEIDALLAALSTGEMSAEELKKEETGKRVKVYDFKRALRFSKDQIRSLTRIHENFARLLTTFFAAQLRTYVQISVASADQIPYEEFIRSIPKMTFLNVFEVPPLNGHILMEVNPNIAYAMLDRVMGGKGTSVNKIDNLTEIETRIISNLFDKAFSNLRDAWESVAEIDPVFTDFEVNPQFLQMISPNDTVVVISLNTQIGETSGMMNICIPYVVLEPIIPKLSVHYWMQAQKKKVRRKKQRRLNGGFVSPNFRLSLSLARQPLPFKTFCSWKSAMSLNSINLSSNRFLLKSGIFRNLLVSQEREIKGWRCKF